MTYLFRPANFVSLNFVMRWEVYFVLDYTRFILIAVLYDYCFLLFQLLYSYLLLYSPFVRSFYPNLTGCLALI